MGALLDPPTADVSGRALARSRKWGASDEPPMKARSPIWRRSGEGWEWFGRWGVNYIYGTWSALAGLNAAGVTSTILPCTAPPSG
jgi:squalene-hopene/tetraprenyl-beta-curcumene cyclase